MERDCTTSTLDTIQTTPTIAFKSYLSCAYLKACVVSGVCKLMMLTCMVQAMNPCTRRPDPPPALLSAERPWPSPWSITSGAIHGTEPSMVKDVVSLLHLEQPKSDNLATKFRSTSTFAPFCSGCGGPRPKLPMRYRRLLGGLILMLSAKEGETATRTESGAAEVWPDPPLQRSAWSGTPKHLHPLATATSNYVASKSGHGTDPLQIPNSVLFMFIFHCPGHDYVRDMFPPPAFHFAGLPN